ncbi:MAG: hypothetical protein A3B96_00335 [Candidatus Spechtbacteria bacterium RIFCSPHIGHO2_02_FULL_43_15b]|uniref:Type 4 fimbrial biogenesis protein PilX N-terminal domain-containing protein n=1 Tax=Candidatus Spechtbacteria bacterium RIFCSPHIGHO2_01_FULL_43_30 TaxID=1802158 RepID=A0A1G2H5I9_9BACT|nr:MAG: hypothetical protein A2827_00755 [Candidatus Spechtbacteria bacterium RIFCSPHIGHO2_01_FULL_43_30]OGZ59324.1 MAG: hypothetical protein A3B96_00335 [Candidatus Spechtbacteria bacterium RIFCSPHIGHO2_02_FULL_43_15b]
MRILSLRDKNLTTNSSQKGVIAILVIIVVMTAAAGISLSVVFAFLNKIKTVKDLSSSYESVYAAESGIEDALFRLGSGSSWVSPYTLQVGDALTEVTISSISGGVQTITSEGVSQNRFRRVQAVYEISSVTPGFFFGAQVGDLGIEMENNSQIVGNVFSNGDIEMENDALITGTVKISDAGNQLSGGDIGGDAYVDTCINASVGGTLYALTSSGCGVFVSESPPVPIPLPIPSATIDDWKADAEAGGTTTGNYNRSSGTSSLGPRKIAGNMTIQNDAQVILTGTVWVTGDVIIKNNTQVRVDSGYETMSGVFISDGNITLENNSISSGSGQAGSYLMYISTSSEDPAIIIKNNAIVDILYASSQFVQVENNAAMREITGNGLRIKNNATVTYEIGLQDAAFISGPSGGWTVTSWKEIP